MHNHISSAQMGTLPPSSLPSLSSEGEKMFARVRLGTKSDVGHIHKLIRHMATYYHLQNQFSATEESLSATLFNYPPFKGTTVFLLEVSKLPFCPSEETQSSKTVTLSSPIADPEEAIFKSGENDVVVAGFVLFFPNYSTFLGQPGFHLEDLFVREGYRRFGLGKMLFLAVAAKAAELGLGRVEWTVVEWNLDGIRFYEGMGAYVLPDWRICRLDVQPPVSVGTAVNGGGGGGGGPVDEI